MLGECQQTLILAPGKHNHQAKSAAAAKMNVSQSQTPLDFILDVVLDYSGYKNADNQEWSEIFCGKSLWDFLLVICPQPWSNRLPSCLKATHTSWVGGRALAFMYRCSTNTRNHIRLPLPQLLLIVIVNFRQGLQLPLWVTGKEYSTGNCVHVSKQRVVLQDHTKLKFSYKWKCILQKNHCKFQWKFFRKTT